MIRIITPLCFSVRSSALKKQEVRVIKSLLFCYCVHLWYDTLCETNLVSLLWITIQDFGDVSFHVHAFFLLHLAHTLKGQTIRDNHHLKLFCIFPFRCPLIAFVMQAITRQFFYLYHSIFLYNSRTNNCFHFISDRHQPMFL